MMKLHTLKVWNARDCLIALKCCLDIRGHLSGQMIDPWVKVKVKGQVDLWGHKVGHNDL